jgi:seryl-tRNA synthetase
MSEQNQLALARLTLARQENAEYLKEIERLKDVLAEAKQDTEEKRQERDENVDNLLLAERENAKLKAAIRKEREKQKALEQEVKVTKQGADARLLSLTEANSAYVDSIQVELASVDLSTFSAGDLQRLTNIFLNEMSRVNQAQAKQAQQFQNLKK